MAGGIADNMLVTTYLSMKAPVFIAPAMDLDMFAHPSTQHNLDTLRSYGNIVIEPASGELASHLVGKGRMEEPDVIVRTLSDFFEPKDLKGKHILITAGPTYERIDPVRFVGNYSSGKMGFALAEECARRGADVTLVSGPTALHTLRTNITRVNVESAADMYEAAHTAFSDCDAAILSAAVADFTPTHAEEKKIKREKDDLQLSLKPTIDIAASLGKCKNEGRRRVLAGFALETNDEVSHAEDKLRKKNFDFIVLNSLKDEGAGFRCDTNKITIIDNDGRTDYPLKSKGEVAVDIVDRLSHALKESSQC
jgi:phosphopantothenoylcysteine decarboxylase/phosphopantothenate--cysteine ligase